MRYKTVSILAFACVVLFASVSAEAATGKRIATAGAMELLIPVGARSTALGGSNIANVQGIDAMYWNPAGVCEMDARAQAMFSQLQWIGDINVSYFAAVANLGSFGSVGLNVKTLNFGEITETTMENPDGTGSTFSPNYLTFGATYSRKMTDRIHFGATFKMVSEKIISTTASGMAVDLGLQYVNAETGLKLGVALLNFGGDMKFQGSDLEERVQLPGTETGSTPGSVSIPSSSFDMPSQLKLGVSYDLNVAADNMLTINGAFVNNAYAFDQYVLGGEYNFRDMFFLRGAYSLAYREGLDDISDGFESSSEDFLFGPSFGAGFNFDLGPNLSLMLDYAYQTTEFFDDNQWFSFTIGF